MSGELEELSVEIAFKDNTAKPTAALLLFIAGVRVVGVRLRTKDSAGFIITTSGEFWRIVTNIYQIVWLSGGLFHRRCL